MRKNLDDLRMQRAYCGTSYTFHEHSDRTSREQEAYYDPNSIGGITIEMFGKNSMSCESNASNVHVEIALVRGLFSIAHAAAFLLPFGIRFSSIASSVRTVMAS